MAPAGFNIWGWWMTLWENRVPHIVESDFCYCRHHIPETEFASRWCVHTQPLRVKRSPKLALPSGIGAAEITFALASLIGPGLFVGLIFSKRPLFPLLPHRWSTTCASPTRRAMPRPKRGLALAPTATWTGTRSACSPSSRCQGQESSRAEWGARQVIGPQDAFFFF